MTIQPQPEKWDIWLAPFYFEDRSEKKIRPVLIYENNEIWVISFKITTHKPRPNYIGEYEIQDWKKAGLKYPSVIRFNKKTKLLPNELLIKLGKLSIEDIKNATQILASINNNKP